MSTRSGVVEVAFYRQGVEVGRPTKLDWSNNSSWCLNVQPTGSEWQHALLQLELLGVQDRAEGWVLANASARVNQNHIGCRPILFRFAQEADLLPTGVAVFEVPIIDWREHPPKDLGVEMWHVTIRGCGSR